MKIVADSHIPFLRDYFGSYGELILEPGRSISRKDIIDADLLLVRSITRVDQALLQNTKIKFIGSVTAGADHLDTKWLDEAGIAWSVATGFNAPPVADYVVSAVAALQKKQLLAESDLKAAVIGVGNVGELVVERLRLLGFDLLLCDPVRAQRDPGFISTPLEALEDLDFISIHVPLTRVGEHPTYHFIDKDFLKRQKPGCVILNASRGAVINSKALLEYGNHLHWCLDVWEHEPKIDKAVLKQAVMGTPHIAGYSVQSKIRGVDMIYRIACEKKLIKPQTRSPHPMPSQQLRFAATLQTWRDIVLGVFNPLLLTEMMRTLILPETEHGLLFDEMRNQFNYRHEFSYSQVVAEQFSNKDRKLLAALGLQIGGSC